jgi:hypothetical protein
MAGSPGQIDAVYTHYGAWDSSDVIQQGDDIIQVGKDNAEVTHFETVAAYEAQGYFFDGAVAQELSDATGMWVSQVCRWPSFP